MSDEDANLFASDSTSGEMHINLPPGIEIITGMLFEHADARPDLGTCCACGGVDQVDTAVMINRRCQVKRHGAWGCVLCKFDDGAAVVICAKCRQQGTPVRWGCRGIAKSDGRAPIEEFTEVRDHDLAKHPEVVCEAN